jgi:hypothetical protein
MFGLIPPFKIGEKRSALYKDSIGGASPLEYIGLGAILAGIVWLIV